MDPIHHVTRQLRSHVTHDTRDINESNNDNKANMSTLAAHCGAQLSPTREALLPLLYRQGN